MARITENLTFYTAAVQFFSCLPYLLNHTNHSLLSNLCEYSVIGYLCVMLGHKNVWSSWLWIVTVAHTVFFRTVAILIITFAHCFCNPTCTPIMQKGVLWLFCACVHGTGMWGDIHTCIPIQLVLKIQFLLYMWQLALPHLASNDHDWSTICSFRKSYCWDWWQDLAGATYRLRLIVFFIAPVSHKSPSFSLVCK